MISPNEVLKNEAQSTPVEETSTVPSNESVPVDNGEFLKKRIMETFGQKAEDFTKFEPELKEMISTATLRGAKTPEDTIMYIRDLAHRLGTPSWGENPIRFLYDYLFLQNERDKISSKITKMEALSGR